MTRRRRRDGSFGGNHFSLVDVRGWCGMADGRYELSTNIFYSHQQYRRSPLSALCADIDNSVKGSKYFEIAFVDRGRARSDVGQVCEILIFQSASACHTLTRRSFLLVIC